jgi:FkbM family methyltransferase
MTIRKISELVETPKRDCIYDILGYLDLRLCVDVGAAAGEVTRRIRMAGGCNTRVVAFEPYAGNHVFFDRSIHGLDNIHLIKKAVTDRLGRATFTVPLVVQGIEQGWEQRVGYSSVGFLSSGQGVGQRMLDKLSGRPRPQTLTVDTTSIDEEFAGQKIDFMKVDVQGGEADVLKGSTRMLEASLIDILYIEWFGDPRVVAALAEHDYRLYDSTYVVGHKTAGRERADTHQLEEIGFEILDELKLSTGKVAYELVLTRDDVSPAEAMARVKAAGLSWIQTDLIAISGEASTRFQDAVGRYSDALHHADV